MKRHKRDLSEARFLYRAEKLGWKMNFFGTHMKHERHPNSSIGVIFDPKTGRIYGMDTLAHLARQLKRTDAEAEQRTAGEAK